MKPKSTLLREAFKMKWVIYLKKKTEQTMSKFLYKRAHGNRIMILVPSIILSFVQFSDLI